VGVVLAGRVGAVLCGGSYSPNLAVALKAAASRGWFPAVVALVEIVGVIASVFPSEGLSMVVAMAALPVPAFLMQQVTGGFGRFLTVALLTGLACGLMYAAKAAFSTEVYPARTAGFSVLTGSATRSSRRLLRSWLYRLSGLFAVSIYVVALSTATALLAAAYRR